MLTGQNGILNRAGEARDKSEWANADDTIKLAYAEAIMDKDKRNNQSAILGVISEVLNKQGYDTVSRENEAAEYKVIIKDGSGNVITNLEIEEGSTEAIPVKAEVVKISGTVLYVKVDNLYYQVIIGEREV